jgi:hypothetical protein
MALDDYLRSRLARYLASLPVARTRLPLAIEVDEGVLAIRPAPEPRDASAPPPADSEAWLEPLVTAEGPAVRHDLWALEARLAELDQEIATARNRAEERARRLSMDLASGAVAIPASIEATAEQLGRPPVRSGAREGAILTFATAALAAVTWEVGLPLFHLAGLDSAALRDEALRHPAEVGFIAVFALGVATALFVFTHVALHRALDLFRGEAEPRRRRWLAASAAGAALAALLLAGAMAALREPPADAYPAAGMLTWALVFVLVPAATAVLLRVARTEADLRALEREDALAWDRERARALAERGRRLEELDWLEDEVRALERQRDAARLRRRELDARAIEAARRAAAADRNERAALARIAQTLVGALELDRYEFVRQATARGADELLHTPRRAPEARATLVGPKPSAGGEGLLAS